MDREEEDVDRWTEDILSEENLEPERKPKEARPDKQEDLFERLQKVGWLIFDN